MLSDTQQKKLVRIILAFNCKVFTLLDIYCIMLLWKYITVKGVSCVTPEQLTSGIAVILAILVPICAIAGFYFGRKKEASDKGKNEGVIETTISNVAAQIGEVKNSVDKMSYKIDGMAEKSERDYRDILVQVTKLDSSYKSLHIRVDEMEKRIKQ